MKRILVILLCFLVILPGMAQIKVGFIGSQGSAQSELEKKQCLSLLARYPDIRISFITNNEILKKPSHLAQYDVLWIQRSDTAAFTAEEVNPKLLKSLNEWILNGGKVLLNQESFGYITLLGLETNLPERRNKACTDDGYGRKLGFHAFREHPVFAGLNGGAYIQRPVTDTTVRIIGYFGNNLPANGRVIAVDWDYIFLREESKLVLEYGSGTGKVIAVGGYLSFSMPNLNDQHLALFTAGTIRYLAGKSTGIEENYWYYGPYTVTGCPPKEQNTDRFFAGIPSGVRWNLPVERVHFSDRPASGSFWDVAGERMVIMGAEQGGIEEIWSHPFMALRDYEGGIKGPDSISWLSSLTPEILISPSYIKRTYTLASGILSEVVTVAPNDPNGVVHYEYRGEHPIRLVIRFRTNLRFMWPYSEYTTGTICHGWDADYNAFVFMDRTGGLAVMAGGNKVPSEHVSGPAGTGLLASASAAYDLARDDVLDFVITGTSEGIPAARSAFDLAIRDPMNILISEADHTAGLFGRSLVITTPNDTFNDGYLWALSGTDKFFVTTPGMGSSLVAGYATTKRGWDGEHQVNGRPGYGWYFGRDGEWSGLALLDYGDLEKVKQVLEFYGKYQDLSGKIYHEATTSGVIHYDAADATPLYILLAGRYFRYSNDTAWLRQSWPQIRKAIDFCFSTDTDHDHLIENTNVGHGWVEGGELYGSHATLYLNGCWAAALEESSHMAKSINDPDQNRFMAERNEIMNLINHDFWRPAPALGGPAMNLGFYSYGKNKDGSFRNEITVLPAVPIYLGLTESAKAKTMLDMYAGNTFSTNWGVRIIGDDSPLFKPTGYHYGSVWPLFTGWTALSEYREGNYNSGFSHLMNNLNGYRSFARGYVEEVLNGAIYKPSGVCPHQCWSETMVLQPAIEGMLGLDVRTNEGRIRLAPRLPVSWDSLTAEPIRAGSQHMKFTYKRQGSVTTYTFEPTAPGSLKIEFAPSFPAGTVFSGAFLNGTPLPFTTFRTKDQETLVCQFIMDQKMTLEIQTRAGIGILPVVPDPFPGDSAAGYRVISCRYAGNSYIADLEGPAGTTGDFYLLMPNGFIINKVVNSDIFMAGNNLFRLHVKFPPAGTPYIRRTVTMETMK